MNQNHTSALGRGRLLKLPVVSRNRYERELTDINADRERIRGERTQFAQDRDTFKAAAETAKRQVDAVDATNRRLEDRLLELGRQLSTYGESDPEYAAALEARVARLKRVGARLLAAYGKKTAEHSKLARQAEIDSGVMADLSKRLGEAEKRARAAEDGERRPIDGAPARRDESPSGQLRRAQAHARDLETGLAQMTVANHKCHCQRPLAQEGATE